MGTPAAPGEIRQIRPISRLAVAAASALGWFALVLQLALTIRLAVAQGHGALIGVWIYLDYFTVLTNVLAASALTAAALVPRRGGNHLLIQPESVTAVTASILIVAIVYNLVLRSQWQPDGWEWLADELLHVIMPVLFLGYWLRAAARQPQQLARLARWMLYPIGYLVYALARGAMDDRYPYPFLDVDKLGYVDVLLNGALVGGAFVLVGAALFATSRWQLRRTVTVDNT